MSKRIVTTVLSGAEVALILSRHTVAQRGIVQVPGSPMSAEMLVVFEKDPRGGVQVAQYRIETTVEEEVESWRG